MRSTKALYWAGATAVAAAAIAGLYLAPRLAEVWPGAQTAPSPRAAGGTTSPPPSPVATIAPPSPVTAAPTAQTPAQPAAASPQALAEAAGANPAAASPAAEPKTATPAPAAPPSAPALERPGFDVVRVEPTGETVVAGHAAPDAAVELRDAGRTIAEISADKSGQFVILPPPLSEGRHRLELAARSGGAPAVVSDAVTVEVAAQKPSAPGHAAAPPTPKATAPSPQPTMAAATPAPTAVAEGTATVPAAIGADGSVGVYVRTIEATAAGRLFVKGSAEANAVVRLYLNGSFLADAAAGQDRQWSLTIEHGMSPGLYTIRADEIDRSNGAVLARAEVSFSYPERPDATAGSLAPVAGAASAAASTPPTPRPAPTPTAALAAAPEKAAELALAPASSAAQAPSETTLAPSASAPTSAPIPAPPESAAAATPTLPVTSPAQTSSPSPSAASPANVVVADLRTTTVVRGDNLWDLARRFYGDGTRFRQIYAANASQIRDPNLIYVGQIFVVPKGAPP